MIVNAAELARYAASFADTAVATGLEPPARASIVVVENVRFRSWKLDDEVELGDVGDCHSELASDCREMSGDSGVVTAVTLDMEMGVGFDAAVVDFEDFGIVAVAM